MSIWLRSRVLLARASWCLAIDPRIVVAISAAGGGRIAEIEEGHRASTLRIGSPRRGLLVALRLVAGARVIVRRKRGVRTQGEAEQDGRENTLVQFRTPFEQLRVQGRPLLHARAPRPAPTHVDRHSSKLAGEHGRDNSPIGSA